MQAVGLCIETAPVRIQKLGLWTFCASVIILSLSLNDMDVIWPLRSPQYSDMIPKWLRVTQIAAAFLLSVVCILIPRRPDVFCEGRTVDRQYTTNIASRITYGWVSGLLTHINGDVTLNMDDLPCLPYSMRSQTLHEHFERLRGQCNLWKALIRVHWHALSVQFVLSLLCCVLSFGPQMALYQILKSMELQSPGSPEDCKAWFWVFLLGILILLNSTVDAWLWWVMYAELGIPINEELLALVFAKSIRCKNISSNDSPEHPPPTKDKGAFDKDYDGLKKSRQIVVNLAAVDARRIADFAAFMHLLPYSIFKLILSCTFLFSLMGWESLLAGVLVATLVIPINTLLTKKYAAAQDQLMKASDKRIATVTEVFQGIRQIKFCATEKLWEEKINGKRNAELHWLRKASCYKAGLISVWLIGPLIFSAVSLTTYAFINGKLTASVAFTAMSIYGSLETALSSLPDLLSRGIEAKISADRIDHYMRISEREVFISQADAISFENARIAWPAERGGEVIGSLDGGKIETKDRFILHDLNLRFPLKGLSVIAGRTASGKSLLLAAIIGECDIISGNISLPFSPPQQERCDLQATPANWIIESAVAYVSQSPWMENATIKDNILFGLPYDKLRYEKALSACRLQTDLSILPDGDLTDIGANGVNLSGGQRWRVSFARALYSRAGILVLDDIFSALDAHTVLHVYEHALMGDLSRNRTRILVTHHASLCLPSADYFVFLEGGSMKYAGPVDTLNRDIERLADTASQLDTTRGEDKIAQNKEEDVLETHIPRRQKLMTTSHVRYPLQNGSFVPKKFSAEEKRITGSIPVSVYKAYLVKGKQVPLWVLALTAYTAYTALVLGRVGWCLTKLCI